MKVEHFHIANVMSSPKLAKQMMALIPRGSNTEIHNELKKKFDARKVIAYENIPKLIKGELKTKHDQREVAIKKALQILNEQRKGIEILLPDAKPASAA